MDKSIRDREYALDFDHGRRVEFRAAGIVRALICAQAMVTADRLATLSEDGVPALRLFAGRLQILTDYRAVEARALELVR